MAKVIITLGAKNDLKNIKAYISEELKNPQAGTNVTSKITKRIKSLSSSPEIGIPLESIVELETNYRILVCGNFNVFYRFDNKKVYVIRVLYAKRDYKKILFDQEGEELTLC